MNEMKKMAGKYLAELNSIRTELHQLGWGADVTEERRALLERRELIYSLVAGLSAPNSGTWSSVEDCLAQLAG